MTGSAKLCIWISGLFLMACSNPSGSNNSSLPSTSTGLPFDIPLINFSIPCSYLGVTSDPVSYKSSSFCTIKNLPPTSWNTISIDTCVQQFACGVSYMLSFNSSNPEQLECTSANQQYACNILQAYGQGTSPQDGFNNLTQNCTSTNLAAAGSATAGSAAAGCIQQ